MKPYYFVVGATCGICSHLSHRTLHAAIECLRRSRRGEEHFGRFCDREIRRGTREDRGSFYVHNLPLETSSLVLSTLGTLSDYAKTFEEIRTKRIARLDVKRERLEAKHDRRASAA